MSFVPTHWWHLLGDIAVVYARAHRLRLRDERLALVMYGSPGGQARGQSKALIDVAMRRLWVEAVIDKGPEFAAGLFAKLVAADSDDKNPYRPDWLMSRFRKYPEAVKEALLSDTTGVPSRSTGAKPVFAGTFPKRKNKLG